MAQSPQSPPAPSPLAGLDHINIAVTDLETAAARFRALGFTLKPGQPHANGIQNQHAKFPDGTELELITAPDARDSLTSTYRRLLAEGDGPAFLALFTDPGFPLRERNAPDYMFFSGLNFSPTDRPEHFVHANTADALIGVWLASDNLAAERRILRALDAKFAQRAVLVPKPQTAEVATLPDGDEVILLPESMRTMKGRTVLGVTVRVRNLLAAQGAWSRAKALDAKPVIDTSARRAFLAPRTFGMWLEFREVK